MKISKEDIQRMNRTAHRNALKKNGGQDMFKPKVEQSKKKYTRKVKHKKAF
jgi:stalled ribosome alternative rescue factor ArfA